SSELQEMFTKPSFSTVLSHRVAILLTLSCLTAAAPVSAQDPDQPIETLPGFKANDVIQGGSWDNIQLYSGDVGGIVPIGPKYTLAPGFDWQLRAYYSAKLWNYTSCTDVVSTFRQAYASGFPTLGAGWNFHLGYIRFPIGGSTAAQYRSP